MSAEANKTLIRRYVDELNRRNLAVLDELVAEEVVLGNLFPGTEADERLSQEDYKAAIRQRVTAAPDYRVTIHDMIAEADRVVLCWTNHWTPQENYLGVPPSGKTLNGTAVSIYRLAGGQIVEVRGYWDQTDLWQQLGLIPPTEQILAPK
jgi:steroid delta-isomerase-like uncharacterized protein